MKFEAVVIGVSAGGLNALKVILSGLPETFRLPVIVVQHVSNDSDGYWIKMLNDSSALQVTEANEKEEIRKGHVYVAPPNYHLLVEFDRTFSLSADARVNYARPSIDVLFESAARVYMDRLIGVVLTGSNSDGAAGLKNIGEAGGLTIVQDPATAEVASMPIAAIAAANPAYILPLEKISVALSDLQKL